ncbi:MAG TPA: hypothetical protein VLA74_01555 [Nitrososphaeraceae archaeon]|nr:hypothetical protein [Nitrososphaeraceae archaeon]
MFNSDGYEIFFKNMRKEITQYTLLVAILAVLIYIAVVSTGTVATTNQNKNSITELQDANLAEYQLVSGNLDYVHTADMNRATQTVLLNGITLNSGEFILLYDSTPYASKGHIALNLPCDPKDPQDRLFNVLIGRAPDMVTMALGYIPQLSSPPDMCIYHGQFGFGDPVTDIALKSVADDPITLRGPHSVAIVTHESYIPEQPSFMQIQHNMTSSSQ